MSVASAGWTRRKGSLAWSPGKPQWKMRNLHVLGVFGSVCYTGRQYVHVLGAFRSVYTGRQYVRVLGVTSIVTCVVLESVSLTPYFKEGNPWGGGFQQS